jgi:uncharacterized protein (TIGR00296 family)
MSKAKTASFSYDDGARAVELARDSVESFVVNGQREQPGSMRDAFYERTGVFVRLESTRGRGSLRGCAGSYESDERVGHVIVDAAIEAASEDSCGSEITPSELDNLTVSLCYVQNVVLTDDPVEDIEIGRHGAAIDTGNASGWLYPTVPLEHGWSPAEYLARVCRKAGLAPNAYEREDVMVTLFDGQVFREREPKGSIQELR